ncbi:MAG TPA: flavodoxin family protein [Armatimonadota bacterium]|nr:flavodoxin family protein [Armatimonadota bacterium]
MGASDGGAFVLGVLGSPRRRSNTGLLLERALAGAAAAGAETELIALRELDYASCRHCGGCDKTGRCVVPDAIQQVHEKLRAASHLLLASPIQFSGVSGETKSMIDRAQAFWVATYRLKQPVSAVTGERRGLFLATCGGGDTRVFDWAKHTVKAFFNSLGVRYWDELLEPNTDTPPPMAERSDILAKAEALGRRIVTGDESAGPGGQAPDA